MWSRVKAPTVYVCMWYVQLLVKRHNTYLLLIHTQELCCGPCGKSINSNLFFKSRHTVVCRAAQEAGA